MIFDQFLRVKQRILKRCKHSEIYVVLMHSFQYVPFFIWEYFFIEYFVKMLNIYFIFVLNTVMHKSILKFDVLNHRWWNILDIVFVIEIMGLSAMEESLFIFAF